MNRIREWVLAASILAGGIGVALVLDLSLYLGSRHPEIAERLPRSLFHVARRIYQTEVRSVLQQLPECAQYDPHLFYTLRPGNCRFSSLEFATYLNINSLGLRDSEEALDEPEVIVLGDSFAMGWGVEDEETLSRQLQKISGLKTLNAAIPSYGTVREKLILERLNRGKLKALVLQYCENDEFENRAFSENGNRLAISSEQQFRETLQKQSKPPAYLPGRTLRTALATRVPPHKPGSGPSVGKLFVNALEKAGSIPLKGTPIYLVEFTSNGSTTRVIRNFLETEPVTSLDLRPVQLEPGLLKKHFYVLDDHLRPEGLRLVAQAVAYAMKRDGVYK